MLKYKKTLLILASVALVSTVFTASCIQIRTKDSKKKPNKDSGSIKNTDPDGFTDDYDSKDSKPNNDKKEIQTKMYEIDLPFNLGSNNKGAGIIRNTNQSYKLLNSITIDGKYNDEEYLWWLDNYSAKFINFFTSKIRWKIL